MTDDQLREFLVLSEIGNYQKAADILYISQATLSRHIINLENELGVPLFDRISHTNQLSAAGEKFLPHAKNIVELADGCRKKLQEKRHHEEGNISIAVLRNFTYYEVADLLIAFIRAYPDIPINVIESQSSTMKNMLKDKQCSFAFISELGNASNDSFSREQLCTDVMAVCLPVSHPLAGNKHLTLDQIKDESFIMAPQRGTIYDSCLLACRRSGFEPKIIHPVTGNSIYHFVSKELCVAILLKTPAMHAHTKNTCLVDILPLMKIYINMIYLKRPLTPNEVCFLNFFRSYLVSQRAAALEA